MGEGGCVAWELQRSRTQGGEGFKELTHWMVAAGKSRVCRTARQAGGSGGVRRRGLEEDVSFSRKAPILLPGPSTDWMRFVHSIKGNALHLEAADWIATTCTEHLTAAPALSSEDIRGRCLTKPTPKTGRHGALGKKPCGRGSTRKGPGLTSPGRRVAAHSLIAHLGWHPVDCHPALGPEDSKGSWVYCGFFPSL